MKTVLILGCGYVGRAVGLHERAQGNRVLAITRNEGMADQLRSEGMDVFVGNVHETGWHGFAEEVDWALNCVSAAEPNLEGYRLSYVDGNRSFADWLSRSGFSGPAIYTSSVSVYPDSGGGWIEEKDARASSERSEVILESERVFQESNNPAVKTVLRLGGIYGPERSFLANRIAKAEGALPGYGDYFLNLIRLEDIVGAIGAVFRSEIGGGVFSVVDDTPMLRENLVRELSAMMKVPAPRFDSSLSGSKGSRRIDGRRPANRRISNRKLKETFDWQPAFPNASDGMASLVSS